jgi:hypothetical protein
MVSSPTELGPENKYAGEGQQQSSERMLYKDYDRRCSIEKRKILAVSLKGLGAKTK